MSKLIYANENCPVCFCEYEITNEDEDDYDKVKKYFQSVVICSVKNAEMK